MAKASSKPQTKTSRKAPVKITKAQRTSEEQIEQVSEETLKKLQELGIEPELRNDIEWCLGSYRSDRNPVGLYQMIERAIDVLKREKENKTKGVTAKMISDLEKALKSRD